MKKIQLSGHRKSWKTKKLTPIQGYALVDKKDYKYLIQWKWRMSSSGYAYRNDYKSKKIIWMHKEILTTNLEVDHINQDKLDNRRKNLRICSRSENLCNRKGWGQSKFKGVCWNKKANKWMSYTSFNGVKYYLGLFDKEVLAAKAYNKKIIELSKNFSQLNNI